MTQRRVRIFQWGVLAAAPLAVYGFSTGPPIFRTGAPVDGGVDCSICHNTFAPANSGPGKVTIRTGSYVPGTKQNITITVEDPDGSRWGFQLTARLRSDETKPAGVFTINDDIRVRCAPDGRDGPCNGDREFAEHRQPTTKPGTPGPGVFTVEWTPPDQDVGEIVFYAAGNAANNSNTRQGDHIYTTSTVARPVCNLTEKPNFLGASDAASFRPAISSNSLISIFGGRFASPTGIFRAVKSDLIEGKLPTEFGCVAVEIAGKRAPVFFVRGDQINAQAPFLEAGRTEDVHIILNPGTPKEMRSDAGRVQVNSHSPAFFTFNGKSIAALNASRDNSIVADPSLVASGAPAKPGDILALFGTGFGFSDPVYQPGEFPDQPARLHDRITVTIGGVSLGESDILYAGLSPAAPGLYQVNLRLPDTLPDGDVPVTIRVGGFETQAGATLPVKR